MTDPVPKRLLGHAQVFRDLGQRPITTPDEADRFSAELGWIRRRDINAVTITLNYSVKI